MISLIDLEKKINSELATKINKSEIKHNQLYVDIDSEDLIDVILFLKTNDYCQFIQFIEITAIDFAEWYYRFRLIYFLLSHEHN